MKQEQIYLESQFEQKVERISQLIRQLKEIVLGVVPSTSTIVLVKPTSKEKKSCSAWEQIRRINNAAQTQATNGHDWKWWIGICYILSMKETIVKKTIEYRRSSIVYPKKEYHPIPIKIPFPYLSEICFL